MELQERLIKTKRFFIRFDQDGQMNLKEEKIRIYLN